METTYELRLKVRDYECDIQGIVNNSVYQNYMEHTRHEYLKSLGHDFAQLAELKIMPVVYRIETDYKLPLRSGDEFVSKLTMEKQGALKLLFHQSVYRLSDMKLSVKSIVTAVVLNNGRPTSPDLILENLYRVS